MFNIYIPTRGAEDWKAYLAEPEKHWRTGYSARTLANAWQAAHGSFPLEVARVVAESSVEGFGSIQPILDIVEHAVPMPGRGYSSKNDLFVLAKAAGKLVAITIEGKVSETFGPTLEEWDSGSENKTERLAGVGQLIGLPAKPPSHIRYQLLHRIASAAVEAQRFNAEFAIMLIHSFSPTDAHFEDFRAFVGFYG